MGLQSNVNSIIGQAERPIGVLKFLYSSEPERVSSEIDKTAELITKHHELNMQKYDKAAELFSKPTRDKAGRYVKEDNDTKLRKNIGKAIVEGFRSYDVEAYNESMAKAIELKEAIKNNSERSLLGRAMRLRKIEKEAKREGLIGDKKAIAIMEKKIEANKKEIENGRS